MQPDTQQPQATLTGEPLELKYARHTRNATVFIAIIVGIGVVISVIIGVQISKVSNDLNGTGAGTSCAVTNPNWPNC
jgi:hypothetical protein